MRMASGYRGLSCDADLDSSIVLIGCLSLPTNTAPVVPALAGSASPLPGRAHRRMYRRAFAPVHDGDLLGFEIGENFLH